MPCESALAATRRVDISASTTGPGNLSDWSNCYNSLHAALAAANANDEIWVAQGIYKPDASTTSVSFVINKDNIRVIGGFAGLAALPSGDPDENDPVQFETILSGLLGTGDSFTANPTGAHTYTNYTNNTINIVKFQNPSGGTLSENTVLKGFTIIGAYGNAILVEGGTPTIRECIVKQNVNTSPGYGAGLRGNANTHPVIRNSTFMENQSSSHGGGIDASGSLTVLNSVFDSNRSDFGAAVHTLSNGEDNYVSSEFSRNISLAGGGGAIAAKGSGGMTRVINCVMFANEVTDAGGAIYIKNGDVEIFNSTIADNEAGFGGGGVRGDDVLVRNSILWNNLGNSQPDQLEASGTADVQYTDIQGGWSGTGNKNEDPKFVSPSSGNYRLQCGTPPSPAINAGHPTSSIIPTDEFDVNEANGTSEITPDRDLAARVVGSRVDMGSYERLIPPCPKDIAPPGGDGEVSTPDLLAVINAWGQCPPGTCPPPCFAEFSGDCLVSTPDLLAIINGWGMCECIAEPPGGIDEMPEEVADCMEICEEDPDFGACVTKCLCAIGYYNEECD